MPAETARRPPPMELAAKEAAPPWGVAAPLLADWRTVLMALPAAPPTDFGTRGFVGVWRVGLDIWGDTVRNCVLSA